MTKKCTSCNSLATPKVDSETFQHNGMALRVDNLDFMECPKCKEEFATAAQIKKNDKKIQQAKERTDTNSPTGKKIRDRQETKPKPDA